MTRCTSCSNAWVKWSGRRSGRAPRRMGLPIWSASAGDSARRSAVFLGEAVQRHDVQRTVLLGVVLRERLHLLRRQVLRLAGHDRVLPRARLVGLERMQEVVEMLAAEFGEFGLQRLVAVLAVA